MLYIILVQGFCPLKIKIFQFPHGFCLITFPELLGGRNHIE